MIINKRATIEFIIGFFIVGGTITMIGCHHAIDTLLWAILGIIGAIFVGWLANRRR